VFCHCGSRQRTCGACRHRTLLDHRALMSVDIVLLRELGSNVVLRLERKIGLRAGDLYQ